MADALAEAAKVETDKDDALDVPVPVSVPADPDGALEDGDTSTVVVGSVLDVATGLAELLVMALLRGADVLEYVVVLNWVPLPCEGFIVHVVLPFAEIRVGWRTVSQDARQQTSVG
jgi:hypothetical protein